MMPVRRGFGVLLLVDAVLWTGLVVLAAVALWSQAWASITGFSGVFTPETDVEGIRQALATATVATILGAVCGAATLVLGVMISVGSVRRLAGGRGPRTVPLIVLVSMVLSVLLPALLIGVVWLAGAVELVRWPALWMVVVLVLALPVAAAARLAQAIAGIVTIVTGEPVRRLRPR